MTRAKNGDTVRIHYTGKLTDGTAFDSSHDRQPLEFQLGAQQILPGLDREVAGMEVGSRATVTIPAADAYGPHDPSQVVPVERARIRDDIELTPGLQLQATANGGQTVTLTVVEVEEDQVTVDANHPLAGKDLVFDIELVEIVQAA